jgi:dUTP pyrophosphatase
LKLKGNTDNLYYETAQSSGFDIRSTESFLLQPGEWHRFSTGLFIDYATEHECLLILPRSGLAAKYGVTVLNSPGLIDSDYPGEIKVILINHGLHPYMVNVDDRIAQGILLETAWAMAIPVKDVIRTGGFGSTGD